MSDIKPVTNFPWQPQSEITGNLAIGNLRENLLQRLRDERGVHAETLVTAIGALAGFAAQNAALNRAATMTSQLADLPQFSNGLVLVETKSGEQYLFGDWINVHLFNDPGSQFPLYGLVATSAIQIGVNRKDLPDYEEIARHVVSVIDGPEFGKIRAPVDHQPIVQPLEILRKLWPFTCEILRLPLPKSIPPGVEPPLQETYWPIIISIVASQFLVLIKDALNPRISFALAMESAVIASKINPEIIEPGKWKIEVSAGKLKVTRLIN